MNKVSILDALGDAALFQRQFKGGSWKAWKTFLAALFGERIEGAALELYRKHTGRMSPPDRPAREAWVIAGRRGGKSRVAALVATYLAAFRDHSGILAPGERGVVMCLAADRRQARTIFRYAEGLIDDTPMLEAMVVGRTRETIEFSNNVDLEIHTSSFRSIRGYSVVAAILDEVSFWRSDESANPDTEILRALRPSLATTNGLLLAITTPYARRGEAWRAFKEHHGAEGDPVLVWNASTRDMNATIDQAVIDQAYEEDPASAGAEYGGQFRVDVESFVTREAVDAVVVDGRRELGVLPQGTTYFGFVDPSGGSQDSFTLAIAHRNREGMLVLDALRERRPPFSPDQVTREFCELLKLYRVHAVHGDRYAGMWPREKFAEYGVHYIVSSRTKSEIYGAILPALNSGRLELLDDRVLVAQLMGLERKTSRAGRDSIDHAPRGRDDVINAAAGALLRASERKDDMQGVNLGAANDDFIQAGEFGGAAWSFTAG